MFCITFVQIGVFDWLSGRQKGSIFVKKRLKIFFSETIWKMKPKLGILAYDITLYKSYVLFRSDENSGCYGNLLFP